MKARTPAEGIFRLALLAFPADFRARHGGDMRSAFRMALGRRRRDGRGAAIGFVVRASCDALRQGWTERSRRGPLPGHGSQRPGDGRRGGMLEGIEADVRLALRTLRRAPGFTVAAVVVLALGIGANTTVFSALEMAILAPLPFPDADNLVMLDLTARQGDEPAEPSSWSYPKYQAYLESADRMVEPSAGYAYRSATLSEPGEPAQVPVELVSPGYFALLGRDPVVGRGFAADEGDAGDPRMVTVISWGTWQSRFGGDLDVVGSSLTLNGRRFEIVGVAPRGFEGLTGGAVVWVPMASAAQAFNRFMVTAPHAHWFHVVGRLREGVTLEQAKAQAASVGSAIDERYPLTELDYHYGADVRRMAEVHVNDAARAAVLLLAAAAGLVLLVACANLSGLLLARAKRKSRDAAVRVAVGASRWRLVRGSLVESAVLAALGGGAGVLLAYWGTRALAASWPGQFLQSGNGEMAVTDPGAIGLDPGALGFALLATAATALLFGVAPALRASRGDVVSRLKESGAAGRRGRRLLGMDGRSALVGAQVALALVLLVGAGLVGTSVRRLLDVDLGFDADHLLTFSFAIPRDDAWADDASAFHTSFLERIRGLPSVREASIGTAPLAGHWSITLVQDIPGHPAIVESEGPPIGVHPVGDDYFATLGVPVISGRALDARDGNGTQASVVINELAAERLFPGEDPVGRTIKIGVAGEGDDPYATIVGVVGDLRHNRPDEEAMPELYYSSREFSDRNATAVVRTTGEPTEALASIRAELAGLSKGAPISDVTTGEQLVAAAVGDRRVVLALLALFAAVTVLLAATGTWGIVSYAVADRRRELGLRMALGSDAGAAARVVMSRGVWAAALGVVVGLGGAWIASRLLETFLFQTTPRDPPVYVGGAALLMGVVLLAGWLPARRVARVDPSEALRAE